MFKIVAVEAQEAGPILKKYLKREPITRPYFDAQADSPVEAFIGEAALHPVFRLEEHIEP